MELISVSNLSHSYDGASPTLSNIDFTVQEGEVVYVSGPSGGGKSTILKILNRLLEPTSGKILFRGAAYESLDVGTLRKKIQLVQQTPVLFDMSVLENLRLATPDAEVEKISRLLDELNLPPDILKKNGKKLSVGQAQRVCLARSLLLEPDVLLLDEPTAPLDPENREIFQAVFEKVRGEFGLSAVWVTHDLALANKSDGRRFVMDKGRLNGR
jgi:putative ABC transport system ATP-binding protein